jgi:chromosome partitioning protein
MRVTVGNLKGGAGKTTTAVYLALGLAEHGRTLLIDADPEQPMAFEWSEVAQDWPADRCTVVRLASRDLARRARPMLDDYAHVIFDVGPKNPALLRQAMSLSDLLLVPARPTTADLRELEKTFDLAAEVDAVTALRAAVLLVQVQMSSSATEEARKLLAEIGLPVMGAQVRLLKRFALAFGSAPGRLWDYTDVVGEVMTA